MKVDDKIISYVASKDEIVFPELQRDFSLSYKRAKEAVDVLVKEQYIEYDSGIRYKVKKKLSQSESQKGRYEPKNDTELRYIAGLFRCVKFGKASTAIVRETIGSDFGEAINAIQWMQNNGFVAPFRKGTAFWDVKITKDEFMNKFGHLLDKDGNIPIGDDEDEDDDDFDIDELLFDDDEDDDEDFLPPHLRRDSRVGDDTITSVGKFRRKSTEDDKTRADEKIREKLKEKRQALASVLNAVAARKFEPVTSKKKPAHPSWQNDEEFENVVMNRIEKIVKTDKRMGKSGAVKKAEVYLDAVRDTSDWKMTQVYERVVYELKISSDEDYRKLREALFKN